MEVKKYPLSVVTLTKNSADKIKDCLESIAWCDDIVIIDDFSTDNSLEIAKKYTNNIYQRKWENEGRHRNFAYSKAKNEYILSLDSDERITPELKEELIKLIKEGFKFNGYNIPHRNYIGSVWLKHGGWYPNKKLKLFKKSEFRYAEEEYHPPAIMDGERYDLKGEIIHLAYKNFADMVNKINHQTNFEAKKWIRDKRKMSLRRALRKASDRFWKAFLLKRGFEDGLLGFIMAFFGSFYQILSYAKYWEMKLGDCHNFSQEKLVTVTRKLSTKKLSVVIPTKNCQDDIGKCLESVKWADEIVIIDGYSTDKTLDICRQYTKKIIQHKHQGDYYGVGEEERNIGIDNSTGDWILQLDSDEVVTEGMKKDVEKILNSKKELRAAYKFRRKNFFLGHFMRFGGWYHYSLHFFKRGKARYEGNIHETLLVNGKVGKIEGTVEHYPFKNISQFIERHNCYSTREAKMLLDKQGVLDEKTILYNIKKKPLKLFWKFYIKKKGFLEGKYGLIFSILFAWVHFLNWSKYWELVRERI